MRVASLVIVLLCTPVLHAAERANPMAPLRDVMVEELNERGLPSIAMTVTQHGQVVFDEAIGLADRERQLPATTNTSYSLASVSKIMTGAAIVSLAERGSLDLDAPIDNYLGDARLQVHLGDAKDVTVRRVLDHTAGLPLHYHFLYADGPVRRAAMDDSIRKYGHVVTPPGERFTYSNFGYGLLDYVIERRSGKPYGEYLSSAFFTPLGMRDSATVADRQSLSSVAVPYGGNDKPVPDYDFDHRGASAVFASTRDLAKFGAWFLGYHPLVEPGILSAAGRKKMVAVDPAPAGDGESTYGLGINVRRDGGELIYSHSGNMPGVFSSLTMAPERGVAVAVAINSSVEGTLSALLRLVEEALTLSRQGQLDQELVDEPVSAAAAKASPPGALPPETHGVWRGDIHTDAGRLPIVLTIPASGPMTATVSGKESQPVQPFGEEKGLYQLALPTVQIPTTDAQRYTHGTLLRVVPRGDQLNGSATAFGAPGVYPMGSALSYWIDLKRESETGEQKIYEQ